jgi:hypothetical protein
MSPFESVPFLLELSPQTIGFNLRLSSLDAEFESPIL